MPEKKTLRRLHGDQRDGNVREELDHIREGKQGARSSKQAIAIGLSKARRSGVRLPPPPNGKTSEQTRRRAARDFVHGQATNGQSHPNAQRSRATMQALRREGRSAASFKALARHAKGAARRRARAERTGAARRAAWTRAVHARRA